MQIDSEIRKLFIEKVCALHKERQETGNDFFSLKPDKSKTSYYKREDRIAGVYSVEPTEIVKELEWFWKDSDDGKLLDVAKELERLLALVELREDASDISPFIYEM